MKKSTLSVAFGAFVISLAGLTPALASDSRIEFNGGIGSTPFASVNGVPAPNDVRHHCTGWAPLGH